MPMLNIERLSRYAISPLISETLPTMSAYAGVATKADDLDFSTIRALIQTVTSLPTSEHLLHLINRIRSEINSVLVLENFPVVIVGEDVVNSNPFTLILLRRIYM